MIIKEFANAKINLTLEVSKENDDGYHDIVSFMAPVFLHDTIIIEKNKDAKVLYKGPFIKNNSIIIAAEEFLKKYHIKDGVSITLDKKIPIGAGLAGGSADLAATLRGLNNLFEMNISYKELDEIASSLGSDTTFCLYNRPSICIHRGEVVKPVNFNLKNFLCLLVKPSFSVSTKDVYQHYELIEHNACHNQILDIIKKGNVDTINKHLFNDLETTTLKLYPELLNLKKELEQDGLIPHMSGSGPTYFVLFDDENEAQKCLFKYRKNYYAYLTRIKN